MDKKNALEKIDEIYSGFQAGNIIRLHAGRLIAYGTVCLLLVLYAAVKPLYWFVSRAEINRFLMNDFHRVLFIAVSVAVVVMLFFAAVRIADKTAARDGRSVNKNITLAFALYKPILCTIITLVLSLQLQSFLPDPDAGYVNIVSPLLLVLVGYILNMIGRFSDRKILILSAADIILGLLVLLIHPVLKAVFYIELYFNNPFPVVVNRIIYICIGVSLILTGIFHEKFGRK